MLVWRDSFSQFQPGLTVHFAPNLKSMDIYSKKSPDRSISVIQPDEPQYRQEQVMSPEQFTQVFEAILEGKYSWACVLTLKFTGYNPLHYIPYRTYKRLLKENSRKSKLQQESLDRCSEVGSYDVSSRSKDSSNQSSVHCFSSAK